MRVLAFDTETFLITPEEIVPKMVCASFARRVEGGQIETTLCTAENPFLEEVFKKAFQDPDVLVVGHNLRFDLSVVMRQFPALQTAIWEALAAGRMQDTIIRESLLRLSTSGAIAFARAPDGSNRRVLYSLEALCKQRLGVDVSEDKGEDHWRLNYHLLAGKPSDEWPEEAKRYALDDARHTLEVFESQQADVKSTSGYSSLSTAPFHTASSFALYCNTITGMKPDHAQADKVRAYLDEQLNASKLDKLLASGILRPDEPSRPHLRQMKKVRELLGMPADWQWHGNTSPSTIDFLISQGIKFSAPKRGSVDQKLLRQHILDVCAKHERKPKMTDPDGDSGPQVSLEADAIEPLAELDEVLAQYAHRAGLQKLVTTELGCLTFKGAPSSRVHPNFNPLVETGRTSSTGNGKSGGSYPARNIQNPHEMARPIFVPDEGMVMASCDYSSLELVTLAQTCYRLFGKSVMRDLINAGVDLHAYLGSNLAMRLHGPFCEEVTKLGLHHDPMRLYEHFRALKKAPQQEVRDFYKHWRTFAKPTNLGYPGGLGPRTFVTYARKTYEVTCSVEVATELREVWRATFPEVAAYHEYVSECCKDPDNQRTWDEETERWEQPYAYTSVLGMHRAGTTFCAAANGMGMQTPGAEGAKAAHFEVMRAMYDPASTSVLSRGAEGLAFIHDEILAQFPEEPQLAHDMAMEMQRIMEQVMQEYVPDVKVRTEVKLMRRWYKEAEPVFENGILRPWEKPVQSAAVTAAA